MKRRMEVTRRVASYLGEVGASSVQMVQLFVVTAIGIVDLGRLIMVLAERMAQRLKERKEKFREGLITQGEARGEAHAELAAEVVAWNERRRRENRSTNRCRGLTPDRALVVASNEYSGSVDRHHEKIASVPDTGRWRGNPKRGSGSSFSRYLGIRGLKSDSLRIPATSTWERETHEYSVFRVPTSIAMKGQKVKTPKTLPPTVSSRLLRHECTHV